MVLEFWTIKTGFLVENGSGVGQFLKNFFYTALTLVSRKYRKNKSNNWNNLNTTCTTNVGCVGQFLEIFFTPRLRCNTLTAPKSGCGTVFEKKFHDGSFLYNNLMNGCARKGKCD